MSTTTIILLRQKKVYSTSNGMKFWLVALCLIGVVSLTHPTTVRAACAPTVSQKAAVLPTTASQFTPEVPLPGFAGGPVTGSTIAEYIRAVFVYFIWIVGLLAVFMVTYGGFRWVAAAGNPGQINDARATINNAIVGLIIALTSVLLLQTINPDFTKFTGLTIKPVDPCLIEFLSDVTDQSGIINVNECAGRDSVGGEPSQACTTGGCVSGYNDWINTAAGPNQIGDALIIKAIIDVETRSNPQGYPISGPAGVPERPGSQLLSTSYGLSQMIYQTLRDQLIKVNGGSPPACAFASLADARQSNGSLNLQCAAFLDQNLPLQVKLVGNYVKEIEQVRCIKNNPTMIALGYHLGQGGIEDYCQGKTLQDTTMAAAVGYAKAFNTAYQKVCQASPSIFSPHTK